VRTLGVISDTHGLLRPEALTALAGVERILHAGDIGTDEILIALRRIAPVTAVRGNNDRGPWAEQIAEQEVVEVDGQRLLILHDLKELERSEGYAAVITGHSHKPNIERRDGVLFLNPGSAGPRRFSLPITVAKLRISGGAIDAEILPLNPASDRPGSRPAGAGTKSGRSSSSRRGP
jgi:putative phosphoesterase